MTHRLGLRKRLALELYKRLEDERIARHELRTLFWECTLRCNLACRHCGSDCRTEAAQPDMPAANTPGASSPTAWRSTPAVSSRCSTPASTR